MRWLFFVFIISISLLNIGTGQTTDATVSIIKVKYRQLQKNLNHYIKDSLDLPAPSEGGMATIWHIGKEVKIIKAVYYYESGKAETNYYFDSSRLFFVLKKQYTYNVPFYITEGTKENNNEVFDERKTSVQEERFYFNRSNLIRWINGSKPVDITTPKSKSITAEILKDAADLKQQFTVADNH